MKYLRTPTWKELYAHSLLISFYFFALSKLAWLTSVFLVGDWELVKPEMIRDFVSLFIFSILFIFLMRDIYKLELKNWFITYFVVIFFLRYFIY